jgi:ASC-1-like (ASCH) protein
MSRKHLKTRAEWEDALRSGRKTIDARWLTDEIAGLKVGDAVRYPGAKARVKAIRFYRGFHDLLAYENWQKIAPDARAADDVLPLLENGHGAAASPSGVVAIELEPFNE